MKYEVVKGCVIQGKGHQAGTVVDLDDKMLIDTLMGMGRLIPHVEEEKVIDRSPVLDSGVPKTRSKKKA
jgi:hypothetical protein